MPDPGQRTDGLPWPFRPDADPYHFVEIAPDMWIQVVLAGDYNRLLEDYLRLQAAAQEVIDVWKHYGHRHE